MESPQHNSANRFRVAKLTQSCVEKMFPEGSEVRAFWDAIMIARVPSQIIASLIGVSDKTLTTIFRGTKDLSPAEMVSVRQFTSLLNEAHSRGLLPTTDGSKIEAILLLTLDVMLSQKTP
jgi:hypothetical protein